MARRLDSFDLRFDETETHHKFFRSNYRCDDAEKAVLREASDHKQCRFLNGKISVNQFEIWASETAENDGAFRCREALSSSSYHLTVSVTASISSVLTQRRQISARSKVDSIAYLPLCGVANKRRLCSATNAALKRPVSSRNTPQNARLPASSSIRPVSHFD